MPDERFNSMFYDANITVIVVINLPLSACLGLVNQSVFPTSNTSKFDVNDIDLDGLLAKNKLWAESILEEDPNFFKRIATMQQPKILWIGKISKNRIK